jgi:hypothetical protein
MKYTWRRQTEEILIERESGEGWVGAGRGTGRLRGAVRMLQVSVQMNVTA